jgi:hypothetical protein
MAVFVEDFAVTRTHARKRVYARVIALHCLALFDDISALVADTVRSDPELRAASEGRVLFDAVARLRPIRHRYEQLLRSIRNSAIAHRDRDANNQLEIISAIDVRQIFRFISEIYKWETDLKTAFLPILKRIHDRLVEAATPRARAAPN